MSKNDDFRDDSQGDFADDYPQIELDDQADAGEQSTTIRVKVSDDRGDTWHWFDLDMAVELEESGLQPGQLVNMNSEKYEVFSGEFGDIGLRPYKESKKKRR